MGQRAPEVGGMTQIARIVLSDCRKVLGELKSETKPEDWSWKWAAFCALLRCIGHVLYKVDSKECEILRSINVEEWRVRKDAPIFTEFIEKERNNILKQYKFSGRRYSGMSQGAWQRCQFQGAVPPVTYEISDGTFKGQDPREVGAQALDWWNEYLDILDEEVRKKKSI